MGINHLRKWLRQGTGGVLAALVASTMLFPAVGSAAEQQSFNVSVSPSPLVISVKPGEYKTATITVRNQTAHTETLYPSLKGFDVSDKNSAISIKDTLPANLAEWITFKQSVVSLEPGGSAQLEVAYATPQNVGFSYSLAIVLSRQAGVPQKSSFQLQGAVAVFNLINVDRPDAKSDLSIASFTSKHGMYEFLPAQFDLSIKNNGNVIGQPKGTLFIQRSFDDEKPLATIPLNQSEGYVLPNKSRTFSLEWSEGFPRYVTEKATENGKSDAKLTWNWKEASNLRFGKYVAKVVLVYNDGQRDVAVTTSQTFWVIPWRLIGGMVLIAALVIMGIAASGWLGFRAAKKVKHKVRGHGK